MKKSIAITIIIIFCCGHLLSQQYDNWYFGRKAALNFSTGSPLPLSNSAMNADEAAASISDSRGQLLFYTNGVDVFNRHHQLMQNGNNIGGNISACQMQIIPQPGSDSLFYIFTTDAIENNYADGYKYSLVDISKNNGDGAVVFKQVLLNASCTERMAAARHANGIDVWFITNDYNSNIFRSWLITCNGLVSNPVVSVSGAVMNQHVEMNSGMMTVSPDGKTLCQTHFPLFDDIGNPPNFFQLFDFDNSTGIISNARSIAFNDAQYNYGAFSPDSKLLYVCRTSKKMIDQFQVSLPTLSAIKASRFTMPVNVSPSDIKLGPDERIYISHPLFPSLGVINNPNTPGAGCDYQGAQASLGSGFTYLGLPSQVNDIVSVSDPNNGFRFTILDSCSGTVQFNGYSNLAGPLTWSWNFGDGNSDNTQNPVHVFTPANRVYTVSVKVSSPAACGKLTRSRQVKPSGVLVNGVNFDIIRRCDSGYYRFVNTSTSLLQPGVQFVWDFGDQNSSASANPVHTYSSPGTYQVTLRMLTGTPCLDAFITKPVKVDAFTITTIPDQVIRVGDKVFLSSSGSAGTCRWTPAVWLSNPGIRNPVATPLDDIMYKVTLTDTGGCQVADSVFIKVLQYADVYVPGAFTPNHDGLNDEIYPFYPGTITLRSFTIYNRFGQQVFSTNERNKGWDGRIKTMPQSTGVFVWVFHGEDSKGAPVEKKGSFVLIR